MKKSRVALLLTSVLCAAAITAGCGSSNAETTSASSTDTETATESQTADTSSAEGETATGELSGTVSTDGSTSMEQVIGYLSEAFMEANPGVTVSYNPTGSGSGITAAQEGSCDIGLASRDLKEDETGLDATVVAIDGIAIIVNKENPISDLSLDQISKIYTGEIKNWSEVGGSDGEIVCIGREAGSGTRDGFESITGTEEKCVLSQELTSTGDVITTVAGNPNAIGYASLSAVGDETKTLTVDGVAPSEETVLDGSYKIQRNFNLLVNSDKELSPQAQAFFDYATSADAADLIRQAGAVPVAK